MLYMDTTRYGSVNIKWVCDWLGVGDKKLGIQFRATLAYPARYLCQAGWELGIQYSAGLEYKTGWVMGIQICWLRVWNWSWVFNTELAANIQLARCWLSAWSWLGAGNWKFGIQYPASLEYTARYLHEADGKSGNGRWVFNTLLASTHQLSGYWVFAWSRLGVGNWVSIKYPIPNAQTASREYQKPCQLGIDASRVLNSQLPTP